LILRISYYPGCSLDSTAKEYDLSLRAASQILEIELEELPDWSCCGASSGHTTDHRLAIALPTRNLLLAQDRGRDLAVACAGCFIRFREAEYRLKEDETLRHEMKRIFGIPYTGSIKTKHLLEIIANDLGWDEVEKRVKRPLKGLKVVSYYGCVLVRPPRVTGIDDPENPQMLDRLMKILGAEALDWSYKTDCCGGSLSLTRTEIVEELVKRIVDAANEAGANCMVNPCPLCQANLDTRQPKDGPQIPSFYFTELLGLALVVENTKDWFDRHIISPYKLLETHHLLSGKGR